MERVLPDFKKCLIHKCFCTPSNYLQKIEDFEKKCEASLIDTLSRVNIKGMVKSDRYSLPYKKEIKITLNGESYMNGPFEVYRVARAIVKQLLDENVYACRFYMYINLLDGHMGFGKVEYCFRYFEK
jgi:hypothetical protein